MMDKHYLTPLFAPSSIIVLAGSRDHADMLAPQGRLLHEALRAHTYSGTLTFFDIHTSGTLADLAQTRADLAVLALPPRSWPPAWSWPVA